MEKIREMVKVYLYSFWFRKDISMNVYYQVFIGSIFYYKVNMFFGLEICKKVY